MTDVQAEDARDLVGVPDAFDRLWTPHRMAYINSDHKKLALEPDCPFCAAPAGTDQDGLIVHRGERCYVVLNLYPYNSGHLLVCPYEHVASYADISPQTRAELGELSARAMDVLGSVMGAQGFNLGMNQGAVSGAGVAGHLHQHIVPRWGGDMNFFPIIAHTKALPELLGDTRLRLAQAWEQEAADAR